jgi:hypothetical protein
VEIEDWLKRSLWSEIAASGEELDPSHWTVVLDTYRSYRGEMLFLPDSLYDRTRQLITDLEQNLNGLLAALRTVIAAKEVDPQGYSTNTELVDLINTAISKVVGDYRNSLDELRTDYQAISRDMLLGEVKPR